MKRSIVMKTKSVPWIAAVFVGSTLILPPIMPAAEKDMMKDEKGMTEKMKDDKGMMKEGKDAMMKDKMKTEKSGKGAMSDEKMKMDDKMKMDEKKN
jgi:hypothetical protein